jgi:hypothetical protein
MVDVILGAKGAVKDTFINATLAFKNGWSAKSY